jgi:carboxyl-terminal processing protease
MFTLLTGILLAPLVFAKIPVVPVTELKPADRHERATEIILHIIKSYHYKNKPLDDGLSDRIYKNYLESLDPNRNFFTQEDLNRFEPLRRQLDDALLGAELEPPFAIFRRYREIVDERTNYALMLLDGEFDFTVDEEYLFDRREEPWALNQAALDELWRKRVKNDYLNLKLSRKEDAEIRDTLRKRYSRLKTSVFQVDANDIFQSFINAYTTVIEPHTSYFSPRASENFDISMSLSLEGIGAVLRSENDYTVVNEIVPGGPADLSGEIKKEDKIIGVGQDEVGEMVDVIGWRLDDVVDLIRGPKGTVVRLETLPQDAGPDGPSRTITITRDKIKLEEQAAKSSIIEFPDTGGRIGVIEIPNFYSDFAAQARGEKDFNSTTRDVRRLLGELSDQRVDGIIIDLRGNGGGSLSEALDLTGLFIETGPIVQTRDAAGRVEINADPDPSVAYGGPLAVLVDRNSASASEIFAGAIQDYHRGIVIGEPTFGKGTVQNIVDLNRFTRLRGEDLGRLKTTIAQFYRISGGSNQHKGVIPDIIYPTFIHTEDHGERSLDNALPWDQVKPAKFIPASAPIDSFAKVKQAHEQRIQSNRLFQLMLEEIELAYQAGNTKVVSLLESKRKAERDKLMRDRLRIKNETRVLQGLAPLPEDADLEEIEEEEEDEGEEPTDVLLNEAANVLYDLIVPARITAAAQAKTETMLKE